MINYKYLILFNFFCILLTACGVLPEQREAPSVFDLGAPHAHAPAAASAPVIGATLLIPLAGANAWIDNTGIQYRLAYQDASRAEAYAQNRWVMTPAQLFTERVRARFAAASRGVVTAQDGAKADYALRIELEDFSQTFDAAQSSKGGVRLRASLIDQNTRALRAQKSFSAERRAAPNAPGAVQALAAASDALVEELLAWAAQQLK
jgi:cholesterol transport system auxiliary component